MTTLKPEAAVWVSVRMRQKRRLRSILLGGGVKLNLAGVRLAELSCRFHQQDAIDIDRWLRSVGPAVNDDAAERDIGGVQISQGDRVDRPAT